MLFKSFTITLSMFAAIANAKSISFQSCGGHGTVQQVSVEPCDTEPCTFSPGNDYQIDIDYTPQISSTEGQQPRNGLATFSGGEQTAYSGQSFDACQYTSCPIQADSPAKYSYSMHTYDNPPIERIMFNSTTDFEGDVFLCVYFDTQFTSGDQDSQSQSQDSASSTST